MSKGKDQQPQAIFIVCLHFLILLHSELRVSLLSSCNAFGGVTDTFENLMKVIDPLPRKKERT